jgi:hypothetical protein
MKITEKNRSLVFLAGTLVMGILIMGMLLFLEGNDVVGGTVVKDGVETNFKTLEVRIDNLKSQSFNPTSYNTIVAEIDASFQQELITGPAKTNLIDNLNNVYSDLVYKQCELFLTSRTNNSKDVLAWLNQLQRITSRNSKIDNYRNQINLYNYYSSSLPNKVDRFIASGFGNYSDGVYDHLKNEVQNMPNFNATYKNSSKFSTLRKNLLYKLQLFNSDYYSRDPNY